MRGPADSKTNCSSKNEFNPESQNSDASPNAAGEVEPTLRSSYFQRLDAEPTFVRSVFAGRQILVE